MSMRQIFEIPGYKEILDGLDSLWKRAVLRTTSKGPSQSFTNTRNTTDGYSAARILPSANSFVDAQKASNNVECDWKFKVLDGVTDGMKFTSVRPLSTFYYSNVDQQGMTPNMSLICTHFENRNAVVNGVCYAGNNVITFHHSFDTLEDANAWLAAEYAKGTPVIVCYPLATPEVTTLSLTPFELNTDATRTLISQGADGQSLPVQAQYLGI